MNGDPRIASLADEAHSDETKLRELFAIVTDRAGDPATRRAALRSLQAMAFTSALLWTKNAELIAALRSVVDDPDQELRTIAIQMLAQRKDEFVQQRLLAGLERSEPPLVADTKAIVLLGYDIHAGHFPTLRRLVQESPDPDTRLEAVKLLAADTESADLLFGIFDDKDEDEELRSASGSALLSVAPRRFEQRAKEAVLDDSEVDGVRAASLTSLTHFADAAELASDTGFVAGVSNIDTSRGRLLASADDAAIFSAGAAEDELGEAVRTFKEKFGLS